MAERSIQEDRAKITSKLDIPGMDTDRWWLLVFGVIGLILFMVFLWPDPETRDTFRRGFAFMQAGLWVSIWVTVVSFLLVTVLGLFGGLGRLSKNPVIHGLATLYVEVIRGIPLMVQILFWYFAFPAVIQGLGTSWNIPSFATYKANGYVMAVLGLTVCYAAYMSEIYRAGIQSIGKGQMEAARSLGMSSVQALRYVVLPQAVRVIMPPMGNEFISLIKDSSLISVVAVADLTRLGREFSSISFSPIETWSLVALLYLVLTTISARIVAFIERKTKLA